MESQADLLTGTTLTPVDQCERHTDEMIRFICQTHEVLGCGVCMILDHRNCFLGYIPDIVETNVIDEEFKTFVGGLEDLSSDLNDIRKISKENNELIHSIHDNLVQELEELKDDVMQNMEANIKGVEDKLTIVKQHDENNMIELQTRCSEYILKVNELKSKSEKLKADGKIYQLYIIMKRARCQLDNYTEMLSNTREECKLTPRIKDYQVETEVNHSHVQLNMSSPRSSTKPVHRSGVNQMLRRRGMRDMLHMIVPLVAAVAMFLLVQAWVSGNREALLQSNIKKVQFGFAELDRLNKDCYDYDCKVTRMRCSNLRIRVHSKESLIISHLQSLYIGRDVITEFNLHVFDLTAGMSTKHISRESSYSQNAGTEKGLSIKNKNQIYRFSVYSEYSSTIAVLNISATGIRLSNTMKSKDTFIYCS